VPVGQDHRRVKMRRIDDEHALESAIGQRLDAMLERACSLRGYSGDDAV
jgi:hypothetical protein